MAVPWTGFPLKALLDDVQPTSKAKYVRLVSFHQPFTAQGQIAFWQPWPYSEALTVQEAMNELTLLTTGVYGHPLPKQHGAPKTFWNTLLPHEYGFTANVDPSVPHPRWPQTKEEMLGTKEIRLTQLYNGYGNFVGDLYS
jgi:sulfoxide reductase catalytic subunit YedY